MKNMAKLNINELKDTVQDCNVNFLIGSGMSAPYFPTLGNIEYLLTAIDAKEGVEKDKKKIIKASIYKKYFDDVISRNIEALEDNKDATESLNKYKIFLKTLNSIMLNRKSTILSKQINIFTTNIDICLEKALEAACLEFNDGFSGRFRPLFDLSNFKKSYLKKSLHYDNTSELPVFNLMKVHGSLTWEKESGSENILFSSNLETVREVKEKKILESNIIEINDESKMDNLINAVEGKALHKSVDQFLGKYEKLAIVNPTKEKFKDTVLNQTYYELLRIFSNELEKENTILFVMGFSFADEHIRKVTVRAANSNPTLTIYILSYTADAKIEIEKELEKSKPNNSNIKVFAPGDLANEESGEIRKDVKFDFETINEEIFNKLLELIITKEDSKKEKI